MALHAVLIQLSTLLRKLVDSQIHLASVGAQPVLEIAFKAQVCCELCQQLPNDVDCGGEDMLTAQAGRLVRSCARTGAETRAATKKTFILKFK